MKTAAKYVGRSESFLRLEIMRERIAYAKIGGRYTFSQADLDAYIKRARVPVREGAR